jgi:hypothetical protein
MSRAQHAFLSFLKNYTKGKSVCSTIRSTMREPLDSPWPRHDFSVTLHDFALILT